MPTVEQNLGIARKTRFLAIPAAREALAVSGWRHGTFQYAFMRGFLWRLDGGSFEHNAYRGRGHNCGFKQGFRNAWEDGWRAANERRKRCTGP